MDLSEKILLIDGHSILNRAFLRTSGSDEFGGSAYGSSIWVFEYYVPHTGGGKTGLSDSGF